MRNMGPGGSVILAEHLTKFYGPVVGLNDLSISVGQGEVRGLLGQNGSGKSTLMKSLIGLIRPTSGMVKVLGFDVQRSSMEVRRSVGYVPESPRLYEFLTATEYLDFIADVRGLSYAEKKDRISRLVQALDLEGKQGDTIAGYSQGMKQKVALMGAILHRPKVLLLDEPLNGLDPKSARVVKEFVQGLAREGVTTIFSTHILEIAEAICDRLTILQNGHVLAEGTTQELREKAGLSGSKLEDVFLKLTGTKGVEDIVEALMR
jgi:ABC-2 type transport system ATP-binding protein